jgi:hypothetical protein
MPTDIISLVNAIPERQPTNVTLTDTSGKRTQVSCVFKESSAPSFFLLFPPDTLPQKIDTARPCAVVSQDMHGETVTFAAKIVEIPSSRVIELIANKSIRPEDLREYFRVNIKAQVEVFYNPERDEDNDLALELNGMTVDISQTGVLTILSGECRIQKPVMIEISLPNPAETIFCSGHVIRSKRIRKNHWLTAFHFDNISSDAREIITKNCFAEQRRQLRDNIHTAN